MLGVTVLRYYGIVMSGGFFQYPIPQYRNTEIPCTKSRDEAALLLFCRLSGFACFHAHYVADEKAGCYDE